MSSITLSVSTNQTTENHEEKKPRIEGCGSKDSSTEEKTEENTQKLSGVNVVLVSKDDREFTVPVEYATKSKVVGSFLSGVDGNDSDGEGGMSDGEDELEDNNGKRIPVKQVNGDILAKIVEFLEYEHTHPFEKIAKPLSSADMKEIVKDDFYVKFVDYNPDTMETLFELLNASNYMDIPSLLDLSCAKVATLLKDKTPEEVKETFKIEGEFTEEEEAKVTAENPWLEEL
jgi:S-phase kinase-associated protein 1